MSPTALALLPYIRAQPDRHEPQLPLRHDDELGEATTSTCA